jgi:hypothetical protein
MGERVYQAAPQPKRFVILHGLSHDAAYRGPIEQWWDRAITFIQRAECRFRLHWQPRIADEKPYQLTLTQLLKPVPANS